MTAAEQTMTCPVCGWRVLPEHSFCEGCGHRLVQPSCTACAAPVDAEGYCEGCGLKQPGDRDHREAELPCGAAGVSDRGLRHRRNEDAMALTEAAGLTVGVVCDGVSTSPRPDQAAAVAAETGAAALVEALSGGHDPEAATRAAFGRALRAVAELAATVRQAPACTYLSAIAGPGRVTVGWVGDSRAYWLPDGAAPALLTVDDVAQPGVLTAWLGADAGEPTVKVRTVTPDSPGQLLICTDGLWGYFNGQVPGSGSPLQRARELLRHALGCGGRDNITAVVIPVPSAS
ncbi:protein phosphatase 2C domain-containing protein [Nonomuraea sp. NPDC050556]|uniref:protein phosphatase 2C domain-containing protein n=1 Tax=Nonomuraea sp. NPDC050556 TaxID=3364369 RepID=UPI00378DEE22